MLIQAQVKNAFIRVTFIQRQKSNPFFRVGGRTELYFMPLCNFLGQHLSRNTNVLRRTAFLNKAMPV